MSIDIIKNNRENKTAHVFRNMFTNLPAWDNFFNHISDGIEAKEYSGGNMGSKEVVGKVNFWSRLTMTLDQPEEKYYPYLNSYIDNLRQFQDYVFTGSFCAVSITNKEPTTGKHNDPVDVFYLQCIGSVVWKIFSDSECEYVLNPGDVIYVPSGVDHEVRSLTPRASISFMFEDKK